MNKLLKKALAIGAGTYIGACALLTVFANLDYRKNEPDIMNDAPDRLRINEYSVNINGKTKKLALIGENHLYTQKETSHALKVIKAYGNIGLEGSTKSTKDKLTHKILALEGHIPGYFYVRGTGRNAMDSDALSYIFAKQRFCLENQQPLDAMDYLQKFNMVKDLAEANILGPLMYFKGKAENKLSNKDYFKTIKPDKTWKNRENEMTLNIESILNKDNVDKLACFVGLAHIDNIDSNLNKSVKIKRIRSKL